MKRLGLTKITQEDRAAAGARYLDRLVPGWARRVKIKPLDLSNGCDCVLGQLAETIVRRRYPRTNARRKSFIYEDAIDALDLDGDDAFALGFVHRSNNVGWESYPRLTRAWRAEIRRRR